MVRAMQLLLPGVSGAKLRSEFVKSVMNSWRMRPEKFCPCKETLTTSLLVSPTFSLWEQQIARGSATLWS